MTQSYDKSLGDNLAHVRSNWGWFVVLGAAVMFFGLIALSDLLVATFASIFVVGVMMIASGISHVLLSFRVRTWSHFLIWIPGGILDMIAGALVLADPILASTFFTPLFTFVQIASGAARIWLGLAARPGDGWGWLVASGIVTFLTGVVIAEGWPIQSLWVVGMILAVNLLLQGWGYITLGLALRARI